MCPPIIPVSECYCSLSQVYVSTLQAWHLDKSGRVYSAAPFRRRSREHSLLWGLGSPKERHRVKYSKGPMEWWIDGWVGRWLGTRPSFGLVVVLATAVWPHLPLHTPLLNIHRGPTSSTFYWWWDVFKSFHLYKQDQLKALILATTVLVREILWERHCCKLCPVALHPVISYLAEKKKVTGRPVFGLTDSRMALPTHKWTMRLVQTCSRIKMVPMDCLIIFFYYSDGSSGPEWSNFPQLQRPRLYILLSCWVPQNGPKYTLTHWRTWAITGRK